MLSDLRNARRKQSQVMDFSNRSLHSDLLICISFQVQSIRRVHSSLKKSGSGGIAVIDKLFVRNQIYIVCQLVGNSAGKEYRTGALSRRDESSTVCGFLFTKIFQHMLVSSFVSG